MSHTNEQLHWTVGPKLRFVALVWLIGSLVLAALTLGSATGLPSMKGWPLDAKVFMAIIHLGVLLWSLAGAWACAFVLFGRETLILDDATVFLQWQIGAWKGTRTFSAAECQNFRINVQQSKGIIGRTFGFDGPKSKVRTFKRLTAREASFLMDHVNRWLSSAGKLKAEE